MPDRPDMFPEPDFSEEQLQLLFSELFHKTGYNFSEYAHATVVRRLQRRIIRERLSGLKELIDKVRQSRKFAGELVEDFSIHVTELFRDPHVFRYFREKVIPLLRAEPFIRVWIAGCATGEEAYSLAILLKEEGLLERCRIYATDMNEKVILQAKTGCMGTDKSDKYEQNYTASGGKSELSTFLDEEEHRRILKSKLLDRILFSHHNLAVDRSFNEFHAIFCRNVLIYFNRSLQDHVHDLLYNSLRDNGFLVLGDKESIRFTKYASRFAVLDPLQKIYRRLY